MGTLIGQPELILLDEPFSNLDPSSQIKLKTLLKKTTTESQITFLISSHDLTHVTEICQRIVLLDKGVIKKRYSYRTFNITGIRGLFFKIPLIGDTKIPFFKL